MDEEPHPVLVLDYHDACDKTGYCRRCGMHELDFTVQNILCAASDNLIAISHLRALQIANGTLERIAACLNAE